MKSLVLAEYIDGQFNPASLSAITAASQLADETTVLLAGSHCGEIARELISIEGVHQVLVSDFDGYQHPLAETISLLIQSVAKGFDYILAAATTFGKNILPRVAAKLNVAQISDIVEIVDKDTFVRSIYAGNAFATIKALDNVKVITVRATSFAKASKTNNAATIETLDDSCFVTDLVKFVATKLNVTKRPELTQARVVISGGRGLQSAENFKLLEKIADKLNAAIGASRAAVDAGFVPNDYQVGQTGKIVAPELYIAVGISGAIQHVAGMKDSKVIVAINKDPEAPIFQIADYGLVGDLFKILPELEKIL